MDVIPKALRDLKMRKLQALVRNDPRAAADMVRYVKNRSWNGFEFEQSLERAMQKRERLLKTLFASGWTEGEIVSACDE